MINSGFSNLSVAYQIPGGFKLFLQIFSTDMKNIECKKSSLLAIQMFHFGTENREVQLKHPVSNEKVIGGNGLESDCR